MKPCRLLFVCALALSGIASASVPVKHKSEGCVIGGKVYSVYQGQVAYRYQLPAGYDVCPYEGRKVGLDGDLSPGDHFAPRERTLKNLGPCDPASRKLIDRAR